MGSGRRVRASWPCRPWSTCTDARESITPLPHARAGHRSADHDLQQPRGLQGRPEARGFRRTGREKNIVAVKESSHDSRRITDMINLLGDRFAIVLRRRRPVPRKCALRRRRLGLGPRQFVPARSGAAVQARQGRAHAEASSSIAGSCRCCISMWRPSSSSTSSSPTR